MLSERQELTIIASKPQLEISTNGRVSKSHQWNWHICKYSLART